MPIVHFDSSDKFPAYDVVANMAAGGVPALLSDEELDFFHDARSREDYIDAVVADRTEADDRSARWLEEMTKHFEAAGIPVPATPTAAEPEPSTSESA